MNLHLLDFIRENANWLELLQSDPYNITVKDNGMYMLFLYNQISSVFSEPIVQECRGLILRKSDYKPVCVPFYKFFNVQEIHASWIDWNSARVQEKIDGSIIKLWFDDEQWQVSTNGTIDAFEAKLAMEYIYKEKYPIKSFGDLFVMGLHEVGINWFKIEKDLNKNYTYIFEAVSPYNRIVVPYENVEIYHLGTRDLVTGLELDVDLGIQKPHEFNLHSLDECLEATKIMPFNEEGYVVVDKFWNRVKIKSPAYVVAHHLKNNGVITLDRILDLIRTGEQAEFISYYPEWKNTIENLEEEIYLFLEVCINVWYGLSKEKFETKKEFAEKAKLTICPPVMFAMYDGKADSIDNWFWSQSNERILKMLGK